MIWLTSIRNGSIHRIISLNCREEGDNDGTIALLIEQLELSDGCRSLLAELFSCSTKKYAEGLTI